MATFIKFEEKRHYLWISLINPYFEQNLPKSGIHYAVYALEFLSKLQFTRVSARDTRLKTVIFADVAERENWISICEFQARTPDGNYIGVKNKANDRKSPIKLHGNFIGSVGKLAGIFTGYYLHSH